MEISLRRRHALVVKDGAFSHKIDYISIFWEILNLKGNLNRFIGSKVVFDLIRFAFERTKYLLYYVEGKKNIF